MYPKDLWFANLVGLKLWGGNVEDIVNSIEELEELYTMRMITYAQYMNIKNDLKKRKKIMNRGLGDIYFRIERNGRCQSVCLSDMTEEEIDKVFDNKNRTFAVSCVKILAKTLRKLGDEFDIVNKFEHDVEDE